MTTTESARQWTPVAGRIGAVLHGFDLRGLLDDDQVDTIRRTLLERRVVFFRDQFLSAEDQLRFARTLGPLTTAHPTITAGDESPNIYDLDSLAGARANHWHTDVTFVERPPTFSVLRADVIPEVGGDTLWADTVAAFADMRPELQEFATRLRAVHTNSHDYVGPSATTSSEDDHANAEFIRQFLSQRFETEHPVVRVHPETGEHALLLGGFAQKLVGYPVSVGSDLLRIFHNHVVRPENTVRWSWRAGDVAIWDNRSTQHYALFDYGTERRHVHRVTTAGDVPVGVDGRPSASIQGDAQSYQQG